METTPKFKELFKKARLRAGFATLSEFGKKLGEEGLIFEDSLFSRWQNGTRIPKDRKTLLKVLKVFIDNSGINSLKEANGFLESAGQGYLTPSELGLLPNRLIPTSPFLVPPEVAYFTGREYYIARIKEETLNGRIVLIHGPAGIGKTALTIKIGHVLRQEFPDGVLWYRLDTSSISSILASIARAFGESVNDVKDIEIRASIVRSLLSTKKILLILDNAELDSKINLLIPNSPMCSVLITSRNRDILIPTNYTSLLLERFTQEESFIMLRKILGRAYVERNKFKLLEMADMVGNLPLAINIFAKQIFQSSKNIRSIYKDIREEKIRLETLKYENKNFYASMSAIFKNLERRKKDIFVSLGMFGGKDFSLGTVAAIHKMKSEKANDILEDLVSKSLVERSVVGRYRLHPLIRVFALQNLSNRKLYYQAGHYYEKFLEKCGRGNKQFYSTIEVELDNILFIFNMCYELKFWESTIKLWEYIGVFLWDMGQWDLLNKLGKKVYKAGLKSGNNYARALCSIRELSWLYYWQGDIDLALNWAKKGLEIAILLGNKYLTAYAKQRLGKIYQSKNKYNKAEKLLQESIKLFKQLKEDERLGDTLTYLGELYVLMGDLKTGEILLNKALKLTHKINDINQNAIVLGYLGEVNYVKKNYSKAKECFTGSLSVAGTKGMNVGGKVWCNIGLALLEQKYGNNKEAIRLVEEAHKNMTRLGIWYDGARPLMKDHKKLLRRINYLP